MFSKPFQWLTGLPLLLVTGALAVIAIFTLAGAQSPDAQWRERLFDYFQRLDPAVGEAVENFHLVLIDRASVEAVGPWPWPRTVLASLVEEAGAAGAKGVVVTEAVDAPDPLSPETIGEFWLSGARDETLAQQLALLPRTDARLAEAFLALPGGARGAVAVSDAAPLDPNRAASFQRTDIKGSPWLSLAAADTEFLALPVARYFYAVNEDLARAATPSVAALASDGDGVLRDWWTEEDKARFKKLTQQLAEQYSSYEVLPGEFVNGELTLGENIADLGGLTLAYMACEKVMKTKKDPMIDGFTWQQRFFFGWANVWKGNITDEALRNRILTDPHSPGEQRVIGPLVNIPEFEKAFNCKGSNMSKPDEERIKIW